MIAHVMSRPPRLSRLRVLIALAMVAPLALTVPAGSGAATPAPVHQSGTAAERMPAGQPHVALAAARARHLRSADNPLAGHPWGVYLGNRDEVAPAFHASSGYRHKMLARIARRPRVHWFGSWVRDSKIHDVVRDFIRDTTHGRKDVLVQMAIFRMVSWEGRACNHVWTNAQRASYRRWIDRAASAVGRTHAAVIMQPDLPFAECVRHNRSVPLSLIRYGVRRFSNQANTTVYLDAGASDWLGISKLVKLLEAAGIRRARGFALNATHYDSTVHNIGFGHRLLGLLRRDHIYGKHFVISTAENGHPFTAQWYRGRPDFNRAPACRSLADRRCTALGIPPTTQVASRAWHLPRWARGVARRHVDGYLWIGRPWTNERNFHIDVHRAVRIARTTPWR
jgi:endoglucanase